MKTCKIILKFTTHLSEGHISPMSGKEINKPQDQVERNNQGDRASEGTSKDSVISGDRKDHQAMHQEASKAGYTFDTFSDNNHDQSFKAIQPAACTLKIL